MSDEQDGIIPGSLAARVLKVMHAENCDFEAGELAEVLQADLVEVRSALAALRKLGKVTMRPEGAHPIYRLPQGAGARIPNKPTAGTPPEAGEGRERPDPPASKSPGAARADPVRRASKPARRTPMETMMPSQPLPADARKHDSKRNRIIELLEADPGMTSVALAKAMGSTTNRVIANLAALALCGRIHKTTARRPFGWAITEGAQPPPPAPHGTRKMQTSARADQRARNLAEFGAVPVPAPTTGLVFAIDAAGNVAIEHLRLPPPEIARLVDFLERTQHVWKAAA